MSSSVPSTSGTLRAERDASFYTRFLLMGIAALGVMGWFFYDGGIKYPAQAVRAKAFLEIPAEERDEKWPVLAREKGWSIEDPGKPKTQFDIVVQFVMGTAAGLVGLTMLINVWRSRGTWVEADDSGVTTSRGQRMEFDQVLSIDKKKWRSKGIAVVKYNDGGRTRKLVLDNFKYMRDDLDAILRRTEAAAGFEKITGGPRELTEQERIAQEQEQAAQEQDAAHQDRVEQDNAQQQAGETSPLRQEQ